MANRSLTLLIGLALASTTAFAQMGTGRVTGSTIDTSGNPIVGARITATGDGKTLEAVSGDDGKWAIMGFRNGTYEFAFAADGFAAQAYQQTVKGRGRNPQMNITMEPTAAGPAAGGGGASVLGEANALFEEGKYDEALVIYEQTLADDPTLYQVNLLIGNVHFMTKDFEKSRAAFETVLEYEPMHTGALVTIGNILVEEQNFDEAITYFEKAIDQTEDEIIPFNVAEIYFNRGNAAKAIEFYQVAVERKPDWADGHLKLAYAYLNTGDMEQAAAAFEKVVEVAPESQQAAMAQAALTSLK